MMAPALELLDQPRPDGTPRVKFCGFVEPDGIHAAVAAGADAIGLNFWSGSKRHVRPEAVRAWFPEGFPPVVRIGVFVNPGPAEVLDLWQSGLIHAAQLHGDEPVTFTRDLLERGIPVIRAFGFANRDSMLRALEHGTPYLLADAPAPGVYGGTGRAIDWSALAETAGGFPGHRLVLSGGLHPGNVAAAATVVRPRMVDSASGVESAPGIKDPEKCRQFIHALRPG